MRHAKMFLYMTVNMIESCLILFCCFWISNRPKHQVQPSAHECSWTCQRVFFVMVKWVVVYLFEKKQILQRNAHGFCIMSWPTCLNICTVSVLLVLEIRVCHVGLWIYCTSFYIKTLKLTVEVPKKHFRPSFRLKPFWAISLRESTQKNVSQRCHISAHVYNDMFFMILGKPKSPSWVW